MALWLTLSLVLVVLDQLLKYLVIENISLPEEVEKALDERTKLGIMQILILTEKSS